MTVMQSHLDAAIGPQGYALHGQEVLDWEDWEPPWHGASAKLSRAEEHYWALHSEVWRFLTEMPPAIRFDVSPDLGPDWYTFSVKFSEPPVRIAIIFGDMVANLRSALDHSLTAVNLRAGRRAQFPISDEEVEFEKFAKGWVSDKGSPELVDFLRPHQPYNRPPEVEVNEHWLRMLATINNSDKHRTLVITNNAIADNQLSGQKLGSPVPVQDFRWYALPFGPDQPIRADEVKLLAVHIPHLPADAELDLHSQVFTTVAVEGFENILEVAWVLLSSTAKMTAKVKSEFA